MCWADGSPSAGWGKGWSKGEARVKQWWSEYKSEGENKNKGREPLISVNNKWKAATTRYFCAATDISFDCGFSICIYVYLLETENVNHMHIALPYYPMSFLLTKPKPSTWQHTTAGGWHFSFWLIQCHTASKVSRLPHGLTCAVVDVVVSLHSSFFRRNLSAVMKNCRWNIASIRSGLGSFSYLFANSRLHIRKASPTHNKVAAQLFSICIQHKNAKQLNIIFSWNVNFHRKFPGK